MQKILKVVLLPLLLVFVSNAAAQMTPTSIPQYVQPYNLGSGSHSAGESSSTVYSKVISIPDALSLQLEFSNYNLGDSSYIKITSLLDGSEQKLDTSAMEIWKSNSAYFNGNAVRVDLVAAGSDTNVSMSIGNITVGEDPPESTTESICGTTDNRVPATTNGIGRLVGGGYVCTGWLTSTGANLTAGHCNANLLQANNASLQFNVPASTSSGGIIYPSAANQYPVTSSSVVTQSGSSNLGNDWAVFQTGPNLNGNSAIYNENYWFRMSRDYSASALATVRITGFGADGGTRNFTEQTHASSDDISEDYDNANDIHWKYRAESEGGNSGGPIIKNGTNHTVGVHTHGGCGAVPIFGWITGNNKGTSFENNSLETAINDHFNTNTVFVDKDHPHGNTAYTGFSALRPAFSFNTSYTGSSDGAQMRIVEGTYAEEGIYTEPKLLLAPVGTVNIIGN